MRRTTRMTWCGDRPALIIDTGRGSCVRWAMRGANVRALALSSTLALAACGPTCCDRINESHDV